MASQLKDLFTPRAAGSNVLLSCYGITCRVFGTTVPVSALPGEEALTFTAHLPDGQDRGLIAVAVHHQFNGHKVWSGYILELTRGRNGLVHVNLEHPWVPEGAQIVQIDHLGLHLLTDTMMLGDGFTTHKCTAKKHGLSYVPDGNLLMRCLAGAATVDEVRAAAQEQAEEKSARERLAELERELPALRQAAERLAGIESAVLAFASALRDLAASTREVMSQALLGAYQTLERALAHPAPMTDARRVRETEQYVRALLAELTMDIREQLSEEAQGAIALLETLLKLK